MEQGRERREWRRNGGDPGAKGEEGERRAGKDGRRKGDLKRPLKQNTGASSRS